MSDSEKAVLGSILLNNSVIYDCISEVEPSDFGVSAHATIFEAMCLLSKEKTPIDAVSLAAKIAQLGKSVNKTLYSELIDYVATSTNAAYHARAVKDSSQRRKMVRLCMEAVEAGKSNRGTTRGLIERLQKDVLQLSRGSDTGVTQISTGIKDAIEYINGNGIKGLVKTGIPALDRMSGGLFPGLLTVLAGRPSMGKSMFAVNIATNAAMAGKRVLLFSLEDTRLFVSARILSRLADVDLDRLNNLRLNRDERNRIEAHRELAECLPISINDMPSITSENLRALSMQEMGSKGIDLLIIDHLGHVREKSNSLYEGTTEAARTIAELPKLLNIPVLLCSQLNRKNLERKDNRPNIGDLRQTGELEQLARVIWLLHRPAYYDESEDPELLELIIGKSSHGPTGTIKLRCNLPKMYVGDEYEPKPWAPPAIDGGY